MTQICKGAGGNEKIKVEDAMKECRLMNNILKCAEEIMLSEMMYA